MKPTVPSIILTSASHMMLYVRISFFVLSKIWRNPRLVIQLLHFKRYKHYFAFLKAVCKRQAINLSFSDWDFENQNVYQGFKINDFKVNPPMDDALLYSTVDLQTHALKFSIVTPLYKTSKTHFRELVRSLNSQTGTNINDVFEVVFVDDSGRDGSLQSICDAEASFEFKYIKNPENLGISSTQNIGAKHSNGEFLIFVDHDDLLHPTAIFWITKYLEQYPRSRILFSDEERFSENMKTDVWRKRFNRIEAYFHNNIHHLFCVEKDLFDEVGGFSERFEGVQDLCLTLRCLEKISDDEVTHIPRSLYKWRAHSGSTALIGSQKKYVKTHLHDLLVEYHRPLNDKFSFVPPKGAKANGWSLYQPLALAIEMDSDACSLVIPTRNNFGLLLKCLTALAEHYDSAINEIIIVDDQSDDPDTTIFYTKLINQQLTDLFTLDIRLVCSVERRVEFNFSHLVNLGVRAADRDNIILLNNDVEVSSKTWARDLLRWLDFEGIAVAGALLHNNGQITHAGISTGALSGLAAELDRDRPLEDQHRSIKLNCIREVSAVTGACLATTKSHYFSINGFDEDNLAVELNDVDFCLRTRECGKRVLFNPHVQLRHITSSTRKEIAPNLKEHIFFLEKHYNVKDPFLSDWYDYSLPGAPAVIKPGLEPFLTKEITICLILHELTHTGAPIFALEMMEQVRKVTDFQFVVFSFVDGPLRGSFEDNGVPVFVAANATTPYTSEQEQYKAAFKDFFRDLNSTISLSKTVFVLNSMVVWPSLLFLPDGSTIVSYIHESEQKSDFFDKFLDQGLAEQTNIALGRSKLMAIFQSRITRSIHSDWNKLPNITNYLIPGGVTRRLAASSFVKDKAKRSLGCQSDQITISVIGTVSHRKNQIAAIETARALQVLMKNQKNIHQFPKSVIFIIYGANNSNYCSALRAHLKTSKLNNFVILDADDDPDRVFKASDFILSLSKNESYPRVIIEAQARQIPVIAVDCPGVSELVADGVNGTLVDNDDGSEIADAIFKALADMPTTQEKVLYAKRDSLRFNCTEKLSSDHSSAWMEMLFCNK